MHTGVVPTCLAFVAALSVWFLDQRGDPPAPISSGPRVPVIVELFSSEGCSSCPPADAYVAALERTQPVDGVAVIALEEHVNYWDDLGWRDPFGSPAFSGRQHEYARVLADHHVFTPEVVFDGHLVMPNGDAEAARAMMQEAARRPKAKITLSRDGPRLTVNVAGVPASSADDAPELWLAITESGLATDVRAGENAGRRLAHAPVVRRLRSLGRISGGAVHTTATLDLEPAWNPRALRAVVFVQLAGSRTIVGAAAISITPPTAALRSAPGRGRRACSDRTVDPGCPDRATQTPERLKQG